MRIKHCLYLTLLAAAFVPANSSPPAAYALPTAAAEARRAQFEKLFADEWEYELRENPELATSIGDYRYNDRWSDLSLEHIAEQRRQLPEWLRRFEGLE